MQMMSRWFTGLISKVTCDCLPWFAILVSLATTSAFAASPFVAAFDQLTQHNPGYCLTWQRSDNGAGLFTNGDSYIVESYIRMYELTRNRTYIDRALALADCIVSRRGWLYGRFEDERYKYVWPNRPGYATVETSATVYGTGMIARSLVGIAAAIAAHDELAAQPTYLDAARRLLNVTLDAIEAHQDAWRMPLPQRSESAPPSASTPAGGYVYLPGDALPDKERPRDNRGRFPPLLWYCGVPLPINQTAAMGRAIAVAAHVIQTRPDWIQEDRGDPDSVLEGLLQKLRAIAAFVNEDLVEDGEVAYWHYWSRFYRTNNDHTALRLGSGAYSEQDACSGRNDTARVIQIRPDDLSHGYLVASFMLDARSVDPTLFSANTLMHIARLLPDRIDAGYDIRADTGAVRDLLSGIPDLPKEQSYNRYRSVIGLWLVLADYDPAIYHIAFRAHYPELRSLPGWTAGHAAANPDQPGWVRLAIANFAYVASAVTKQTPTWWVSAPVTHLSTASGSPLARFRTGVAGAGDGQHITIAVKKRWRPRQTVLIDLSPTSDTTAPEYRTIHQRRYAIVPGRTLIADLDCDGSEDMLVVHRGAFELFSHLETDPVRQKMPFPQDTRLSRNPELVTVRRAANTGCAWTAVIRDPEIHRLFEVNVPRWTAGSRNATPVDQEPPLVEARPLSLPARCPDFERRDVSLLLSDADNEIYGAYYARSGPHKGLVIVDRMCAAFIIGSGGGVCPAFGKRRTCEQEIRSQNIPPTIIHGAAEHTRLLFVEELPDGLWIRTRQAVNGW